MRFHVVPMYYYCYAIEFIRPRMTLISLCLHTNVMHTCTYLNVHHTHTHTPAQWMADHWESEPCYADFSVDGSKCSFQYYLSVVEHWCPPVPNAKELPALTKHKVRKRERGEERERETRKKERKREGDKS